MRMRAIRKLSLKRPRLALKFRRRNSLFWKDLIVYIFTVWKDLIVYVFTVGLFYVLERLMKRESGVGRCL